MKQWGRRVSTDLMSRSELVSVPFASASFPALLTRVRGPRGGTVSFSEGKDPPETKEDEIWSRSLVSKGRRKEGDRVPTRGGDLRKLTISSFDRKDEPGSEG